MATFQEDPTFSAMEGEDIETYLDECAEIKIDYRTYHEVLNMTQEDSQRMKTSIAQQITAGLRGEARLFIQQLGEDTLTNLDLLSEKLKERFPSPPDYSPSPIHLVSHGISTLRQGQKGIDEYVADLRRLRDMIPEEETRLLNMLAIFWVAGLANDRLRRFWVVAMAHVEANGIVEAIEALYGLASPPATTAVNPPAAAAAVNLPVAAANLSVTAANLSVTAANLPAAATNIPVAAVNPSTTAVNFPAAAVNLL